MKRVVQGLAGLVFGLGLVEVAFTVRDNGAFPHVNFYLPDAELGLVLEPGATETQAVSRIYEMSGARQIIGTCDSPGEFSLDLDRIFELEGCEVVLDHTGEGFAGGTVDDNCATDWNGADYATSEITLDAELLVSWDRGWSADGEYVWGATAGGYQFVRQSALGEW